MVASVVDPSRAPIDFSAWLKVPHGPAQRILKLMLLKKWSEDIHRLRSRRMAVAEAASSETAAQTLDQWENHLRMVASFALDAAEFPVQVVGNSPSIATVYLPSSDQVEALPIPLTWQKGLLRQDRHWERTLYAEARRGGWLPATLSAEVRLERVMDFQHSVDQGLGSFGGCLWAENGASPAKTDFTWNGSWRCVVDPAWSESTQWLRELKKEYGPAVADLRWSMDAVGEHRREVG